MAPGSPDTLGCLSRFFCSVQRCFLLVWSPVGKQRSGSYYSQNSSLLKYAVTVTLVLGLGIKRFSAFYFILFLFLFWEGIGGRKHLEIITVRSFYGWRDWLRAVGFAINTYVRGGGTRYWVYVFGTHPAAPSQDTPDSAWEPFLVMLWYLGC